MKKKQSLSILLLLLFSMVLGISSRSYCKVTEAQFKNFLYNNEIRNGKSEEQVQAEMQLPIVNEMLEDISQYLNNDNYKIFICSSGYNVYFYEKIATDTNYITVRNNSDIDVTLNGYSNGYQIVLNSNVYRTTSSQYYNNLRNNMVYSEERLVYNGSTWANAPYYRPNQDILSGPYVDDLFVLDSSAYCGEEISISNNLEIEEGFYTFDKQNFNRNIASIYKTGDYLLGVYLTQYYYDKNSDLWKVLFTDRINSYEQDSINYLETLVFLEDINKVPNTMVEIIPLIKDANMPCVPGQEYFYLTDTFTKITNNALDIDNTFSGDYLNDYNNNINNILQSQDNEKIISAIESGNDAIISALTDDTIPSGEEPTIDDLPVVSISSGDDPSNEFFSWLMQEVVRILNDNTETTIVIPIYNESYTIRSDVFKLEIEPLRTFISAAWWFIVGVPFLKYIRRCIEKLKGGEIPASDDKNDLLGNVL